MFFKGLRRAGGSSPGHLVKASLTFSLSSAFLTFFSPFFFRYPSFLRFFLFTLFSSLIFFFIFFSVSPFLTSFLYLDAFPDSFLLRSSPFQSLALSLSLHLSLLSFFTFFFLFFFSFFCFYFFAWVRAPLRGFSAMSGFCILCIL